MSRRARPRSPRALALALVGGLMLALLPQATASAANVSEVEPNNTTAQAQALSSGDTVFGSFADSATCDSFYDCDVYRITTATRGRLTLDLQFAAGLGTDGTIEVKVQNELGVVTHLHEVSSAQHNGAVLRDLFIAVAAGTHYVSLKARVTGGGSAFKWAGVSYTLTPTYSVWLVESEPNSTTATASETSWGWPHSGSTFSRDCDGGVSDCDYFSPTIGGGTALSIDFRFPCGLGVGDTYRISVLDNLGHELYTRQLAGAHCDGALVRGVILKPPAGYVYMLVKAPVNGVTYGRRYSIEPIELPFADVSGNNQFLEEIRWMRTTSISTGYEVGGGYREYRPLANVSREAMAAFLYRYDGTPEYTPPPVSPFIDVPTSSQFYKEIAWLASRGISTGWELPNGWREFRPYSPIARDAMAAFLYRSKGSPAYTPPGTSPFRDVPTSHLFYTEIAWMSAEGISTGYAVPGGKEYRPLNAVARDAMAAFLYRAAGSP